MEKNQVMDEVLGDAPSLTVSDLYSADFKTSFRGFDKERVTGFLARVADAYEALEREVSELRKRNEELRAENNTYRDMEKTLTEALAGAQQLSETTLAQARKEAELIREEAEVARRTAEAKGAAIPEALREEIAGLRAERGRLKADLRAVLDIHRSFLEEGGDDGASVQFVPGGKRYDGEEEGPADVGGPTEEGA